MTETRAVVRSRPIPMLLAVALAWVGGRLLYITYFTEDPRSGDLAQRGTPRTTFVERGAVAPFVGLPFALPQEDAERRNQETTPVVINRPLAILEWQAILEHERSGPRATRGPAACCDPAAVAQPVIPPDAQMPSLQSQAGAATRTVSTIVSDASPPPPVRPLPNRWSASGWAFFRNTDAGDPPISGVTRSGSLGGTQIGVRIARRLGPGQRVETFARLTTAGRRNAGVEGAAGVAAIPSARLPLQIAVERRVRLTGRGGRNAFAAYAAGGVGNVALPAGWSLEGYGAAGVVGFSRGDGFIEGSMAASRPIGAIGRNPVTVGVIIAGGAQPGVSRIDIGPAVTMRIPLATRSARVSVDYRQQIVGNARPGSGLSVTVSGDF